MYFKHKQISSVYTLEKWSELINAFILQNHIIKITSSVVLQHVTMVWCLFKGKLLTMDTKNI